MSFKSVQRHLVKLDVGGKSNVKFAPTMRLRNHYSFGVRSAIHHHRVVLLLSDISPRDDLSKEKTN